MSSVELDDETKKILASLSGVLEVTAAPKLEQRDPLAIPFYKFEGTDTQKVMPTIGTAGNLSVKFYTVKAIQRFPMETGQKELGFGKESPLVIRSHEEVGQKVRSRKSKLRQFTSPAEDKLEHLRTSVGPTTSIFDIASNASTKTKPKNIRNDGPTRFISCSECDGTFKTRQGLRIHFESVHEGIRNLCVYKNCRKAFASMSGLWKHQLIKNHGTEYSIICVKGRRPNGIYRCL